MPDDLDPIGAPGHQDHRLLPVPGCVKVGHRERRADLPCQQRLEPSGAPLVGAEQVQYLHVPSVGSLAVDRLGDDRG